VGISVKYVLVVRDRDQVVGIRCPVREAEAIAEEYWRIVEAGGQPIVTVERCQVYEANEDCHV